MKKLLLALLLALGLSSAAYAQRLQDPLPRFGFYNLYLSSNWYASAIGNFTSSGTVTDSVMYATPFWVNSPSGSVTFKSCGVHIQVAGSGSTMKCALYDSTGTGYRPNNKLAQGTNSGSGTATNTGTADASTSLDANVTLSNGMYWGVVVFHATTTLPTCTGYNTINSANLITGAQTVAGAVMVPANSGGFVQSSAITYSSAFPSTFGTATEIVGSTGCVVAFQVK